MKLRGQVAENLCQRRQNAMFASRQDESEVELEWLEVRCSNRGTLPTVCDMACLLYYRSMKLSLLCPFRNADPTKGHCSMRDSMPSRWSAENETGAMAIARPPSGILANMLAWY